MAGCGLQNDRQLAVTGVRLDVSQYRQTIDTGHHAIEYHRIKTMAFAVQFLQRLITVGGANQTRRLAGEHAFQQIQVVALIVDQQ